MRKMVGLVVLSACALLWVACYDPLYEARATEAARETDEARPTVAATSYAVATLTAYPTDWATSYATATPTARPTENPVIIAATLDAIATDDANARATATAEVLEVFAQQRTSQQAITAFQQAGLEVVEPTAMTPQDYGDAPQVALEGTRFLVPSLCPDCGGVVLSFATRGDLAQTEEYYLVTDKERGAAFQWTFTGGNLLLHLDSDLTEAAALPYRDALLALTGE